MKGTIMKKIISSILLEALFISSCKDESVPMCKTDVISISGSYRITAATYKANPSSSEENYYDVLLPDTCQKDNVYTFHTDGTFELKDSGAVCFPPRDGSGTWSVSNSDIVVDGAPTVIESFDCKTLIFSGSDIKIKGDKLR